MRGCHEPEKVCRERENETKFETRERERENDSETNRMSHCKRVEEESGLKTMADRMSQPNSICMCELDTENIEPNKYSRSWSCFNEREKSL